MELTAILLGRIRVSARWRRRPNEALKAFASGLFFLMNVRTMARQRALQLLFALETAQESLKEADEPEPFAVAERRFLPSRSKCCTWWGANA